MRATYQRIKNIFFWPGLKKFVENYIAQCPVCQRAKGEHCLIPGLLDPLPIPDMAWQHITMDFIEGLPNSHGKEVIVVGSRQIYQICPFYSTLTPLHSSVCCYSFLGEHY